ncbi:hypothetical protein GTA08_BOTSDO12693 [Botryosphaeria dothidea]|uniref:C2H2-type domain-containing protein n=1 Tax=Botryosphaeria dothidea TaxID=55169 RepID=A0A8H4J327_9PEZI|nr:hypothetical protein GTA08_BOTSDO12693 [Botryosphaeria dothidea]
MAGDILGNACWCNDKSWCNSTWPWGDTAANVPDSCTSTTTTVSTTTATAIDTAAAESASVAVALLSSELPIPTLTLGPHISFVPCDTSLSLSLPATGYNAVDWDRWVDFSENSPPSVITPPSPPFEITSPPRHRCSQPGCGKLFTPYTNLHRHLREKHGVPQRKMLLAEKSSDP